MEQDLQEEAEVAVVVAEWVVPVQVLAQEEIVYVLNVGLLFLTRLASPVIKWIVQNVEPKWSESEEKNMPI